MIEFEAVRALPALRAYDDRELAVLLGSSAEREYARGEVIFESGKRAYACVLIVSGEVEVLRSGSERETPIRRYGPGMFLGQTSLVDGRPRTTTVRALTRVVGLEFTRDVFEALLRAHSPLALRFQRQIAVSGIRTLRLATARLMELLETEAKSPDGQKSPTDNTRDVLQYIQSTVDEWGAPLDDVRVKAPERVPTRPFPARPGAR
jgi:CRP-like cAMP-binding protein